MITEPVRLMIDFSNLDEMKKWFEAARGQAVLPENVHIFKTDGLDEMSGCGITRGNSYIVRGTDSRADYSKVD